MSPPLIRLAIGPTHGTAHVGVLLGVEAVTACATHSTDLQPVPEASAHILCQSCVRALLVLSTAPHPGEPEARPATGTGRGTLGHRPIPGHLLAYCGKLLDTRPTRSRRRCALCTRLGDALDTLRRQADELLLPAGEPCHGDDLLLWAPLGRGNLVTGHRRNAVTGKGFCDRTLAGANPGALNECAPCRWRWEEAELVRQMFTLPHMRDRACSWGQQDVDLFDDRACTLDSGDAYTLSGCEETHYVVAVADRGGESHTDLLVYLSGEDRIADLRVRRDRLVAIQRPAR
ncbi:hypothetical protein [Streptomyces albipurpureus]|uniref:Uncharacterized protein n=1 Tax=Streptomyces albipurpureus TaxID=2897419 RepID=A0ABT0UUX9_9ACTN|nr:hypothetical protein [Streptomyces sp. CWNU-1]MCM2392046.1 hypothetical protein [Streptomyces sp. CWNU-1]